MKHIKPYYSSCINRAVDLMFDVAFGAMIVAIVFLAVYGIASGLAAAFS